MGCGASENILWLFCIQDSLVFEGCKSCTKPQITVSVFLFTLELTALLFISFHLHLRSDTLLDGNMRKSDLFDNFFLLCQLLELSLMTANAKCNCVANSSQALGIYCVRRVCSKFMISDCRGGWGLGLCTTSHFAKTVHLHTVYIWPKTVISTKDC